MSDYVSAFDWEMRFISPEEHLKEPDWTAEYEGLMDDAFGLTWSENPSLEQPDEGTADLDVLCGWMQLPDVQATY
ncbi:hypothetical protein PTNB85_08476 [Pyrenophora teres f. teres]|nr:hypothetical protein HRS9139_10503 [Pyrenophora teres f. teres]KAE8822377.1 hypothetical protein HRS9122_10529 [Pyrenophora teres f. teres]KAE8822464.1 hypothetical protein HRS9122_10525 [Pyrenophora teres f. teres]KAE8826595.1 hypothetical protein HRS9122_10097 [Pyrenophora teres f. teres]KAE8829288.1 hypothetical protein PTNB85_08476 [Pyrenophora teres f. teres]